MPGPSAGRTSRARNDAPRRLQKQFVLELLQRKDGATMAQIAKATAWQNHGIRGFISVTLKNKLGLTSIVRRASLADGPNRVQRLAGVVFSGVTLARRSATAAASVVVAAPSSVMGLVESLCGL